MLRSCWHWLRRSRADAPHEVHFVTFRLADVQRALTSAERDLVYQVLRLRDGQRHQLLAFVVMDDHAHVLVRADQASLGRLVHSWKASSAYQLQRLHRRTGEVWSDDTTSSPVRGEEELRQKTEYIVGNPWKRWPFVPGYRWVWEATGEPTGWPRSTASQ